jgi:DNA polymerase-3 subunit delta'
LKEEKRLAWQRLKGHEAVVEAFARAVGRGRLAHAYLFVGPPGIGKRTFAVELAKALLCEAAPAGTALEACDRCPACILVEAGTHPDFQTAARPPETQEFPVDLMREVCRSFALKPARGRGKVVVLDGADDLNAEAANCFLKTLEEPPPRSVLILVGSSPDRQPVTIVSRCQVVRFAPLAPALVEELLQGQGVDDPQLRACLVRVSGGSPGVAMELADPGLWEFRAAFLAALARPAADPVKTARALMDFVADAGKESAAQRRRARLVLRLLVDFLRDALSLGLGGSPRRTIPEDLPALETLAGRAGTDLLLTLLECCLEADRWIERNVQLVLVLEGLLDAFARKLPA